MTDKPSIEPQNKIIKLSEEEKKHIAFRFNETKMFIERRNLQESYVLFSQQKYEMKKLLKSLLPSSCQLNDLDIIKIVSNDLSRCDASFNCDLFSLCN